MFMTDNKKTADKKGFFARLFESLDKKMEEKSKDGCCCCAPKSKDDKKSSCC